MESIRIEILNPKALNLLQDLADLDLIKINKDKSEFLNLVRRIRENCEEEISMEEITREVEEVRAKRYAK